MSVMRYLEHIPTPVGIIDEAGKVIFLNPAFVRLFGFAREELPTLTAWATLAYPDPAYREECSAICRNDLANMLQSADKVSPIRHFIITTKKGFHRNIDLQFCLEGNEILAMFQDRTEEVRKHRELEESLAKYRILFDNMSTAFAIHEMVYDEQGQAVDYRYLEINPAYTVMTGLYSQQLIGKTIRELFPETEFHRIQEFAKVVKTGEILHFESDSGDLGKQFHVVAFPAGTNRFAVLFHDISAIIQAQRKSVAKSEELQQFVHAVSHDLKGPLVTISGFAGSLAEDLQNNDQEAMQADVHFIQNAAKKMSSMLDELLLLSRAGRLGKPPVNQTLGSLVNGIAELLAGRMPKGEDFIEVLQPNAIIHGDPERMQQLFLNLLDNALKYQSTEQQPHIAVGCQKINDELTFFVRDNGLGIDPKNIKRIFGVFEKVNAKSEGSGLGLTLAKRIIEAHQGSIWAESLGLGKGTTFFFTLPGSHAANESKAP